MTTQERDRGRALKGVATADSSGYVDLAALMAVESNWADKELDRAGGVRAAPSSLAPIALPVLAAHGAERPLREPRSGAAAAKWIFGSAVVVTAAVIGLAVWKRQSDLNATPTRTTAAVVAPPAATAPAPSAPAAATPVTTAAAQPTEAPPVATAESTATVADAPIGTKPAAKGKPGAKPAAVVAAPAHKPQPVAHPAAAATPIPQPAAAPAPGGDPVMDAIRKTMAKHRH